MKLKILLLVLLIGTIQHSFGQKVNLLTLKVETGKYLNGNNPYSGLVYELYASGFLKSESEIKNGMYNGLVKKYIDNTKSISTYQDSTIIKIYDDTLSYLSKRLFQLYKDSANYSVKIKRIFDEEIKTSEKLDEWKQKYDDGKLRGNKLEIYTELRNASLGLDASMTNLKLIRQNNLYFQRERKTEKNKPIYTNILSEIYTYVDGNQSGIHVTYKKGGEKDVEQTLDNGKKNGPYKRYSGGKIVEEGNYVNNEKEGEWTTFNSSEKITQNYSKGKFNGEYKRYDGDDLLESGQYVEGLKNGEWKKFDHFGRLAVLNNFKLDKLDGPFKKYSGGPDVLTESGQYLEGLKNGEWKNFDYYGKLTLFQNYKLGKLDGAFKKYSGDVVIEEGIYSKGLMNGEWKFYYNSGKIKGSGKFLNSDGGNIGSTGMPINGREGVWVLYHENGKKSQESSYVQGKTEGKFISYHQNGNKEREGVCVNGTVDFEGNLSTDYNEDGSIKGKFEYKNGKWEEQLTPEERFARMQKQVEEMNEKADKLAERIKNQADKINTKLPATGKIKEVYNGSRGKPGDIKVRTTCCECNSSCFNAVYSDFVIGWDDDPIEFECHSCHQKYILKFTQIQRLFKGDDF
jgi:antitoxin component YwqK of YwqJK toxin-antitoxin module